MYRTTEDIMSRLNEHKAMIEQQMGDQYELFGIFLIGSQNYKLFVNPDIVNTMAVVIPSYRNAIWNRSSYCNTIVLINDDVEYIHVKDIRILFYELKHTSIDSVEWLFTDYYIINPTYKPHFDKLREMRESIASIDPRNAMVSTRDSMLRLTKQLRHLLLYIHKPDDLHEIYEDLLRLYNFLTIYPTLGFERAITNRGGEIDLKLLNEIPFNGHNISEISITTILNAATDKVDTFNPVCLNQWKLSCAETMIDDIGCDIIETCHKSEIEKQQVKPIV